MCVHIQEVLLVYINFNEKSGFRDLAEHQPKQTPVLVYVGATPDWEIWLLLPVQPLSRSLGRFRLISNAGCEHWIIPHLQLHLHSDEP